jgi:hypothetical protein
MKIVQLEVPTDDGGTLSVQYYDGNPFLFSVTDLEDGNTVLLSLETVREVLKACELLYTQSEKAQTPHSDGR